MLAKERQTQIAKKVRQEGTVTVSDLTRQFGISLETVRRDLLAMEKEGLLTRVHGGAVSTTEMMPYHPLAHRTQEQSAQKSALARTAAAMISEGDYIAIGCGSTPIHLAHELTKRFRQLTVVTYSLEIFEILRSQPDFRLILLGGQFVPKENAFYGQLTLDMLSCLHVQKAFVFPSAVSLEHGICGYEETLYPMQQKLLSCCDQAFILADSSKFQRTALYKVADMQPDHIYITDPELPARLQQLYKEKGFTVITGQEEEDQ